MKIETGMYRNVREEPGCGHLSLLSKGGEITSPLGEVSSERLRLDSNARGDTLGSHEKMSKIIYLAREGLT